MAVPQEVTLDHVRAAAERIRSHVRKTAVLESNSVNRRTGARVFFKAENTQRGGSFKLRGAANFLLSLDEETRKRGVVAFSSGNHAQGVAIAAKDCGISATLVMPEDAPTSKIEATLSRGAHVIMYNRFTQKREEIGARLAQEQNATLVPPFDHPWIIAGQGTAALELLEEVPDLDVLCVCVGGGGLLSGSAIVAKALNPSIRVYGVEPEVANDYWLSLRAGKPVEIETPPTIADGLRTTKPGSHNFPLIQHLVDDILLVPEEQIKETTRYLITRMKTVVEPSGAVGATAVLHNHLPVQGRKIGVILSGGNVDLSTLAQL